MATPRPSRGPRHQHGPETAKVEWMRSSVPTAEAGGGGGGGGGGQVNCGGGGFRGGSTCSPGADDEEDNPADEQDEPHADQPVDHDGYRRGQGGHPDAASSSFVFAIPASFAGGRPDRQLLSAAGPPPSRCGGSRRTGSMPARTPSRSPSSAGSPARPAQPVAGRVHRPDRLQGRTVTGYCGAACAALDMAIVTARAGGDVSRVT